MSLEFLLASGVYKFAVFSVHSIRPVFNDEAILGLISAYFGVDDLSLSPQELRVFIGLQNAWMVCRWGYSLDLL